MIKKIGYYLFAACFTCFRLFPVSRDKVFFVATHDMSEEGNVGIVSAALRERFPEKKQIFLTKKDGIKRPFSFFFLKAFHMATAGTIFMDNVFMPMAYTPLSKKTRVVQLWHGTGTIKKFGLDSDGKEVVKIAQKANAKITHLIVNSEMTKRQYMSAFGVTEEKVHILGLPRTDRVLDEAWMEEKKTAFYEQYPELRDKKCILYAPTFRDSEVESPKVRLDLPRMESFLAEDEVLMLRLHPHVAANFREDMSQYKKIRNMSSYPGVTTLLAVSDCLVTDYSSIIFEYCLRNKPMIFYAYDLADFEKNGRNFYENYETFVPGPVVKTQEEWEQTWREETDLSERVLAFKDEMFAYADKNAVNRLFKLLF